MDETVRRTDLIDKLIYVSQNSFFSFSTFPLFIFYWFSALSFLVFCCFSVFALYHKYISGLSIPGWTSIIVIAYFFGSLNSLGIAILGEYIMRIYDQVRARPAFVIERTVNMSQVSPTNSLELEFESVKTG